VGHVKCIEKRNAYKILVRKPEMKIQLQRPRHRWQDNIRMDIREIGWEVLDLMHMSHDKDHWQALLKKVINLWDPQNIRYFLTG
jgi:hypothetical protein